MSDHVQQACGRFSEPHKSAGVVVATAQLVREEFGRATFRSGQLHVCKRCGCVFWKGATG